uniref:Uncharacterized protein n=1 Tax=Anguilla anguilla TaxID=7936 RepID=A0A0E9TZ01_ANGAN
MTGIRCFFPENFAFPDCCCPHILCLINYRWILGFSP